MSTEQQIEIVRLRAENARLREDIESGTKCLDELSTENDFNVQLIELHIAANATLRAENEVLREALATAKREGVHECR